MDTRSLIELFDKYQREEIEYPDMRKDILPHVTRFVRPAPGMSFILNSRLAEANADTVIREQIDYFSELQQPFEWKVYDHDSPADLRQRLVAHGFEAEDPDAVMILELLSARPELRTPVQVDVRRMGSRQQLQDVIQVEEQVWGRNFDWIATRLGDHMDVPDYLSVFVAYVDDQPACTGWIYYDLHGPFASLWGGSTIPAYRGRGLYTAVLARRVQEAIERGFRFVTIDASPKSQPIVAERGFRLLTYAHACEWKLRDGA